MQPGLFHLADKLSNCDGFKPIHLLPLAALAPKHLRIQAGATLTESGAHPDTMYLISKGWAVSCREFHSGKRQIVNFLMPGDFACLNAAFVEQSSGSFAAITDLNVLAFRSAEILHLFKTDARISIPLIWLFAQETSIVAEHLASVGRRSAYERITHLILELYCRLIQVRLATGDDFELPLRLALFGDALGLTPIHVSKTMRQLRKDRLIEVDFGSICKVRIVNYGGAVKAAHFDPNYLKFGTIFERKEFPKRSHGQR